MIQAVMYFVLGLLTAGLVALALSPAIWRRAHRLARARVESSLPMSLGEVQAEKDQLRASFALSARRLELQVEDLRRTSSEQTLAAGRLKAKIATLTADIEDRKTTIAALEARLVLAEEALRAADARIETLRAEVASRDATLNERAHRIAGLEAALHAAQLLTEEQRLELVARDTAIGNLEDQLAASRAAEAALAAARDEVSAALEAEKAAFAAERARGQGLEAQIAALGVERADRIAALERRTAEIGAVEAELAATRAERDALAATVAGLEAERTERLDDVARRTGEIARLRAEAQDGAAPVVAKDVGDNMQKAIESLEAEKSSLEARLASLEASHAAALTENADLRRAVAGGANAADEALRERLAEIAANVLRLTQPGANGGEVPPARRADKGNGAPHLHAVAPDQPVPEAQPSSDQPPKPEPGRSLAERIRALQHAARH